VLSTVHCVVDEVAAQRLVAFAGAAGAGPPAGEPDALFAALREGRLGIDGALALVARHSGRGAFEEARALLERAVAEAQLADADYLRLGDASALVRRAALEAARPEMAIYSLDWELPPPIVLDRFRHLDLAPRGPDADLDRWRGPPDLSARVHLAYTRLALCLHVVARDDIHRPGRDGDRLELVLARWHPERRQWGDRDLRLGLADKAEAWSLSDRPAPDVPGAIRAVATRDEPGKLTTYSLLVPWRLLGPFHAKPGAKLDFALALHDRDAPGPKAALRWTLPEPRLTGRLLLR
jgi:hypothetical protein